VKLDIVCMWEVATHMYRRLCVRVCASICTDSTATKLSTAVPESVQRDALDLFMTWNCLI